MNPLTRNDQSKDFKAINPHLFGPQTALNAPCGALKPKSAPIPQKRPKSALSQLFEDLWAAANGPALTPEFRFAPPRRWRVDYLVPETKLIIELEGITKQGGRHQRKEGFENDAEKYLAAFLMGFRVVRLTRSLLTPANIAALVAKESQK